MELDFIEISNATAKPKATIHITGKLGFNREAVKYMGLNENTYFRVALDKEESEKRSIFFLTSSHDERNVVKVAKAGEYYYLNLGTLFNDIKVDYEHYTVSFDIHKSEYDGKELFTLKRRKKDIMRKQATI